MSEAEMAAEDNERNDAYERGEPSWEGPEALRAFLVPVETLRTHPENPRRGDVDAIAASLRSFGQLKPVIVHDLDGQPTIFAGNHTYRAAVEILGWTHIAAVEPAYLSDDEAEGYLLMDNRSGDLSTYDYGELTAILEERQEAGTLDRTGFSAGDLEQMKAEAARIAGAALEEFRQGHDDEPPEPGVAPQPAPPRIPLRQILLTFDPPDVYDPFARQVMAISKELGTDDISSTIAAVVDRAFAREWGDRPDAPPPIEQLAE